MYSEHLMDPGIISSYQVRVPWKGFFGGTVVLKTDNHDTLISVYEPQQSEHLNELVALGVGYHLNLMLPISFMTFVQNVGAASENLFLRQASELGAIHPFFTPASKPSE